MTDPLGVCALKQSAEAFSWPLPAPSESGPHSHRLEVEGEEQRVVFDFLKRHGGAGAGLQRLRVGGRSGGSGGGATVRLPRDGDGRPRALVVLRPGRPQALVPFRPGWPRALVALCPGWPRSLVALRPGQPRAPRPLMHTESRHDGLHSARPPCRAHSTIPPFQRLTRDACSSPDRLPPRSRHIASSAVGLRRHGMGRLVAPPAPRPGASVHRRPSSPFLFAPQPPLPR